MADLFNTIMTICGVGVTCCCTLFIGLVVVLVSRGRIMVLPAILTFVGSFGFNIFNGLFGFLNRGRNRIYDEDFERASSNLRSRVEKVKSKYDPLATNIDDSPDDVFRAQSVKPKPSADRFTMQPGTRVRPPTSGGTGNTSPLPPPRANLPRKGTTSFDSLEDRRNQSGIDDDFDSLNVPRLRDRRETQRRRNLNDYDDEVMGGVFDDDGDDGGLF